MTILFKNMQRKTTGIIGSVVKEETMIFTGSGKHFFYFTGERLPAGKYFYTIESPLGTVIVKQSLLIVK